MNIVGQQVKRIDAYGKVIGEAKYTAGLEPRDILHGKIVHSTIANGLAKSFDLTEAYQVPGVVEIVTCFDVPDCQFPTAGHLWSVERKHRDICDGKMLSQRVRLCGDDIVAIIAEDEVAAARAARLIKVEYKEYTPIVTVGAAMVENATPLHPDLRKNNVIVHSHMIMGDSEFTYERGLEKAGFGYGPEEIISLEKEHDTPRISYYCIELSVSWAYVDTNGRTTVVSSAQIPHIVRRCTAQTLGVPIRRVRIMKPYIGDGFGSKQDVLYEPLNAFLTVSVGEQPVRLEISQEGTISGIRTRHTIRGKCRSLVIKGGRILAKKLETYANNGVYASHGHAICTNYGNVFKDLYRDELGTGVDYFTIYTSSPAVDAMRTYGTPQAVQFAECLTDDLASAVGMGPYGFRLKNCMEDDFVDPASGIAFHSYGLKRCIKERRRHMRWDEKWNAHHNQTGPVRKGAGMAIFCYKADVHPTSLETTSARMILNRDGSMQLYIGTTEIGQGADTAFTQIASQTTGVALGRVYIVPTQDTNVTPFNTGAYASRQTYVSGMACGKCGEESQLKILEYVACMLSHDVSDLSKTVYADQVEAAAAPLRKALGLKEGGLISPDMLGIEDSKIVISGGRPVLSDLSVVTGTASYSLDRSVHITAKVTNQCKDNAFSSGCCFVKIGVDIPLGLVTMKDIINVHNSGILVNPPTARVQVHGGMSMGLGYGLSEELLMDKKTGRPLSNNLLDYKIPTAMDTPDLSVAFIELENPTGPYGNKSPGGPPAILVAPAIRNAILNATGVQMDVTSMTAQRLIEKSKEKGLI